MASFINLRLSEEPYFEFKPIFCSLRKETKDQLRNFPRVYQRAIAALRFCQQIGHPLCVSDDDREIMQVAYLRAALMEFVAMEEVLLYDLEERDLHENRLKMIHTESAMLILLRELRNLQLHVANTIFSTEERPAIFAGQETTLTIPIVPFEDLLKIKQLNNAKRMDPDQLDAAILWLDKAQLNWGINDLLQRGVQIFADLIIHQYNRRIFPAENGLESR